MKTNEIKRMKEDVKRIKKLWGSESKVESYNMVEIKKDDNMLTLSWMNYGYMVISDYIVDVEPDETFKSSIVKVEDLNKVMELIDDDIIDIKRDNEFLNIAGFSIPLCPLNMLEYVRPNNLDLVREVKKLDLANHKKVYKCVKGIRQHMWGINFSDYGIASTDSKRLFVEKCDDVELEHNITVPGDLCNIFPKTFVLYSCLDNNDYAGAIVIDRQTIYFKDVDEYPEYKNIIPEDFITMIEVDHKTIKNMVNKIKKLKLGKADMVITVEGETVEIRSFDDDKTDDCIKFKSDITAYKEGDDCEIMFNSDYVYDLLNQFDPKITGDKKIKIKFNGNHRPVKVETDDRVGILMPIRV
jgi:hypothetical protein